MSQQLYENGTILTMDEQHGLYAEALLVKDGTIAAVGGRAQVEALADGARKVDLAGRTLLSLIHIFIVGFFMQKYLVSGMTAGAVKG